MILYKVRSLQVREHLQGLFINMYRIIEHTENTHLYVPEDFITLLDAKVYIHLHQRENIRYTIEKVKHENNRLYYDDDVVGDLYH